MGPLKVLLRLDSSWGKSESRAYAFRCVPVFLLLLFIWPLSASPQSSQQASAPPVAPDQIIRNLVEHNETRAADLKYFSSQRHYQVEFHGMGLSLSAQMHVQATYSPATGKTFRIIDESGSHILLDRVLKRLLTTEHEDSLRHEATLSPQNYKFQFVSADRENGRDLYIFSVEPRVKKKLLYRGRIWIDAKDYAVVKIEAEPAENPSFWIKSTHIEQLYQNDGEFWLPQKNRSDSKIRFGGSAVLTIDYGTYCLQPDPAGCQ